MKTCPDISALEVRVTLMGCSEWPDRWNFDFDLGGGDHYPSAPEVLSLDGYRFGDRPWDEAKPPANLGDLDEVGQWFTPGRIIKFLKWFALPEEQRSKTNLDLWLDAMDFSRIHTLSFKSTRGGTPFDTPEIHKLASRLPNLQTLRFDGRQGLDFILSLPPNSLKHLHWDQAGNTSQHSNGTDHGTEHVHLLRKVLARHGESLETLEWRNDEMMSWGGDPTPTFSLDDIAMVAEKAPRLTKLTLNLARNGSWPWEALGALASLPELQNLTIYTDMQSQCRREKNGLRFDNTEWECKCLGEDQYQKPLVGPAEGHPVVEYLLKNKAGSKFRYIAIRSGDWTPTWDGPVYIPPWLEHQRAWYVCQYEKIEASSLFYCKGQETKIDTFQDSVCRDPPKPKEPQKPEKPEKPELPQKPQPPEVPTDAILTGEQRELQAVQQILHY